MALNIDQNVPRCAYVFCFSDSQQRKAKIFAINLKEGDLSHDTHTANTLKNVPEHMNILHAYTGALPHSQTLRQVPQAEPIVCWIDFLFN